MATRVLYDDYSPYSTGPLPEDGDIGQGVGYEQDDVRNMPTVVTVGDNGETPPVGTKFLKSNYDGTQVFDAPSRFQTAYVDVESVVAADGAFLLRAKVRCDPSVPRGTGTDSMAKFLRNYDAPSGTTFRDFFFTNRTSITFEWVAQDTSTGELRGFESTGVDMDTQWHDLAVYVSRTGQTIRAWCNGSMFMEDENTGWETSNISGHRWGNIYLWSNFAVSHDSTNSFYMAELQVFSNSSAGEACDGDIEDNSIQIATGPEVQLYSSARSRLR